MKKHSLEFLKRGLTFSVGGPVILAIVYGILGKAGIAETLSPAEVCKGILTVSLMAFIAAGITTQLKSSHCFPLCCCMVSCCTPTMF